MRFESWGEVPYAQATERQLFLVQRRIEEKVDDTWVFCTHPRVVTLGRASSKEDLQGWTGNIAESSRGGKATFHGPNQVIIYPVVKLEKPDILKFLEYLEEVTVKVLNEFDVRAQKSREAFPNYDKDSKLIPTGVWVGEHKIASIGIAVKRWVTYHGIAINLYEDEKAFTGINPCGFSSDVMTSMEKELGKKIDREEFISVFQKYLLKS